MYGHVARHDPVIRRITEGNEDEEQNDLQVPLNYDDDPEQGENLNPLSTRELSILKQEKATKDLAEDVCSICCDNFEEKTAIRKMPICGHTFHKACID